MNKKLLSCFLLPCALAACVVEDDSNDIEGTRQAALEASEGADVSKPLLLCLTDDACKEGQYCDHSECLGNCPPDQICPAVCWGQCLPEEGDPCKANDDCAKDEFCSFDIEAVCGKLDYGECTVRPEVCTKIWAPVCGCDGKTHSNECMANAAGVSIVSEGECEPEPKDCDTLVSAVLDEAAAIRSCSADAECGQPLAGTSCGCTRDWVARSDADTDTFYALLDQAFSAGCEVPGTISTCDCPPANGFVCDAGMCQWNYGNGGGGVPK